MKMHARALAAAALSGLAGCATYDVDYEFEPAPSAVSFHAAEGDGGRLLATVLGVRIPRDDVPAAIDVRVRLERAGAAPVALDVGSMTLVASDMTALRPADPPGTKLEAAADGAVRDVSFPLPEGRDADDLGLDGLSLLAPVTVGARRIDLSVGFRRLVPVWGGPWWGWPGPGWSWNRPARW